MGYKPGRKALSMDYFQDSRVEPTVIMTFKIHRSGAEDIKYLAKAAGIPVSQYIRDTMTGILSHSFPDRTKELLEMIAEKEGKPANIIVRNMVRRALYYYERKWRENEKDEKLIKDNDYQIINKDNKFKEKGKFISERTKKEPSKILLPAKHKRG